MANFDVFSLSQAMQAGQTMAGNEMALQGAVAKREKSSKAAGLRQRVNEGDSEALGELMALDPKEATEVMNFLNTADDRERENLKLQNESVVKGITWVMQAGNEQERATRWDQVVDHMVTNQGNKDVGKYKGQYSQDNAQMMLMQAMTMDQFLDKNKGSFGTPQKAMVDGQPAFMVTDKEGNKKILKGVQPVSKDVYHKDSKGAGGKPPKGEISNVIAKRTAEYFNVPFTENKDGSISYKFPTSNEAQKVAKIKARATRIYIDSGKISHDEAVEQAIKETEGGSSLKDAESRKTKNNTSAKDWLKTRNPSGG